MKQIDKYAHEAAGDGWFHDDSMEWEEMEIPAGKIQIGNKQEAFSDDGCEC